jgi:hypothetical protein
MKLIGKLMKRFLYSVYKIPTNLFDHVRVLHHCMMNYYDGNGDNHIFVRTIVNDFDKGIKEKLYFCTCKYLVDEISDDYKQAAELVLEMRKEN